MKRFFSTLVMAFVAVSIMLAGETYALITGVSSYADPSSNAHQTTNDAKNFQKIMKNFTKNITLLTSKNATTDATLAKLRAFAAGTKADDRIVFFYSGHGEPNGIYMHNGKTLDYKTILQTLAKSKAKEKILVVHCCHAASIKKAMDETGINDVVVFASSRADEYTIEDLLLGGGYFTRSLEKALMGKADSDGDKKVTVKEAFQYVHKDVTHRTGDRQHPVLYAPKAAADLVLVDWNKKQ